MAEPSITLEEGARRLVDLVLKAEPEHRERIALGALRAAKIAAYQENAMAVVFHASPMGRGIEGLRDGIARALDSMVEELER